MKINAIITGSTGMVGKAVLLECLEHPDVNKVLVINRHPVGIKHAKLEEIIHADFFNLSPIKEKLKGFNACFFCLGVSAVGLSEEAYTKITYDITIHFAKTLLELNSDMTFNYVSGAGTDNSEKGGSMWARVKGKTENALLALSFKSAYMFRPGIILPEKGIKSNTKWYQFFYDVLRPLFPLLKKMESVTTSTNVGKAMINTALFGYKKKHIENVDINKLANKGSDIQN